MLPGSGDPVQPGTARTYLRLFYVTGPLDAPPGGNLNTGLWQGFHLLHAEGLTFLPGLVPWERMPGARSVLRAGRHAVRRPHAARRGDRHDSGVPLQALFYSAALGVFAWAAGLLWSAPAVWTLGLLVSLLPKQLGYTQVDALIAPAALLSSPRLFACGCNAGRDARPIPFAVDFFVHLAFAFWFVMRPDVLPGWLIVSLVLHWRSWRRLAIPLVLFLSIGIGWGAQVRLDIRRNSC